MSQYHFAIGSINVIDPEYVIEIKNSIMEFLEGFCVTNHYDFTLMIFTDINSKGSYLIYAGKEAQICELAFEKEISNINGLAYVNGLMSRKKQVIPAISKAINAFSRV